MADVGIEDYLATLPGRAAHRPVAAREPVSAAAIHQWCDAMGECNPRFTCANPIAPPATLQMWTFPGQLPGRPLDAGPSGPDDLATEVRARLAERGCSATLATATDQEFIADIRPGVTLSAEDNYLAVSPLKRTALGAGYFVSSRATYRDDGGALLGQVTLTVFHFQPRPADRLGPPHQPLPVRSGEAVAQRAVLGGGEPLPGLAIPVTPTLIVAGALATRDFYPVHHDRDFARAHGNVDLVMNVLTTNGLLARVVGEWSGHRRLTRLVTRLRGPAYPHTRLVLSGTVEHSDGDGTRLRIWARTDDGPHAEAVAYLDSSGSAPDTSRSSGVGCC
ncbi:MAG TPA: hypothetical protein VGH89_17430 [Pseudonocardia sp.]|jgi:hypothetical protein